MKKSDLVSGKHILETNNKRRYLVAGNYLPNIRGRGFESDKAHHRVCDRDQSRF